MSLYKSLSKKSASQNDDEAPAANTATATNGAPASARKNKQRVLILSTRGVTYRHRHLINDLAALLPHGKRDAKFDSKSKLYQLNELAELYNCNNVLFFEARKGQDLYMWLSKVPNGPTIKFHVQNMHTMSELNFSGNCLKGSRPVLSFDGAFERQPHLRVIKEVFLHVFGVPQGARRSKPFVDHVMGFSVADGRIWVRNYQISESEPSSSSSAAAAAKKDAVEGEDQDMLDLPRTKGKGGGNKELDISLVEIGPRFVITPIVILEGSFGGPVIYENKEFVSPNQVRADLRRGQASRHHARAEQHVERLAKKGDLGLRTAEGRRREPDALDSRQLFA